GRHRGGRRRQRGGRPAERARRALLAPLHGRRRFARVPRGQGAPRRGRTGPAGRAGAMKPIARRPRIVAGNWKMHRTAPEAAALVCGGETLAEREANRTEEVLVRQTTTAFHGLGASDLAAVVAYEPVWAIGTGKVASPEQARDAHRLIRGTLDAVLGRGAGEAMPILYGGSVNPGNAAALFAERDVDGALVGGASLEAASFWRIVIAAASAGQSHALPSPLAGVLCGRTLFDGPRRSGL